MGWSDFDRRGAATPLRNAGKDGHNPVKMQSDGKSKQAGQGEATRGLYASNMAVRLMDVRRSVWRISKFP